MNDFNVDKLKYFPNQETDGDPTECVALTVTDIAGNADGRLYDPDFTYAMTLRLEGVPPNTTGSDPFIGMQSAVAYGLLPIDQETFTSKAMGELYVANYQNYPQDQQTSALKNARQGIKLLLNHGDEMEGILDYIFNYGLGVSMPVSWSESFMSVGPDGILPAPSGQILNHNVAIYGQKTINGVPYLIVKPWLGQGYGNGGYCYMSREVLQACFKDAYGFDPNASRWLSLVVILLGKFPQLYKDIPALLRINGDTTMNQQTANGQKVYVMAKALLGQVLGADNAADGYGAFACAESVNTVVKKALGVPVGGGASTTLMFQALKDTTRFESVAPGEELPGDIIISPTGFGMNPNMHGHVGIIGIYGICSNNSEDGRWGENYTLANWRSIFGQTLGFPVCVFRVK